MSNLSLTRVFFPMFSTKYFIIHLEIPIKLEGGLGFIMCMPFNFDMLGCLQSKGRGYPLYHSMCCPSSSFLQAEMDRSPSYSWLLKAAREILSPATNW